MFGQTALGSSRLSNAENRMFRYEVRGFRQTYESDKLSYPIRESGSFFITVPYNRMNEEMQRIQRLGGEIVSIKPLSGEVEANSKAKAEAVSAAKPKATKEAKSAAR
ncbi:MAG TPA: phycobilisome linker polypeptide [Candidatus Caenarcaniphilales bacterium]